MDDRVEALVADPPRNLETRYDVTLVSVGRKPKRVAKAIASSADLGEREAWELLQKAPILILQGARYATAERAKEALERRGATVEMRAYEVEVPRPEPRSPSSLPLGVSLFILVLAVIIVTVLIIVLIVASSIGDSLYY